MKREVGVITVSFYSIFLIFVVCLEEGRDPVGTCHDGVPSMFVGGQNPAI